MAGEAGARESSVSDVKAPPRTAGDAVARDAVALHCFANHMLDRRRVHDRQHLLWLRQA